MDKVTNKRQRDTLCHIALQVASLQGQLHEARYVPASGLMDCVYESLREEGRKIGIEDLDWEIDRYADEH